MLEEVVSSWRVFQQVFSSSLPWIWRQIQSF